MRVLTLNETIRAYNNLQSYAEKKWGANYGLIEAFEILKHEELLSKEVIELACLRIIKNKS